MVAAQHAADGSLGDAGGGGDFSNSSSRHTMEFVPSELRLDKLRQPIQVTAFNYLIV